MFGPNRKKLSPLWTEEGLRFASAVNEMVAFADEHGWDQWQRGEPEDRRSKSMASGVLKLLRQANREGSIDEFRRDFPPAHSPFADDLDKNGTSISQILWLSETRLAFIVGTPWTSLTGYELDLTNERLTPLERTHALATSPDGRHIARVSPEGISISEDWDGSPTTRLRLPSYEREGKPLHQFTQLHVFPGGRRVLTVCEDGIYLVDEHGSRLVHPEPDPDEAEWTPYVDMAHAAVSPDGELICVGDQCSMHRVLDRDGRQVARIGLASSYPHHATFSSEGSVLAMNSCHFYNGGTITVPTDRVHGLETKDYISSETPEPCKLLDESMRIYASTTLPGQFLFGGAYGYVRALNLDGETLWQHHVGSSISGLAISPDGRTMAIGSSSGMLHIVDMDQSEPDPNQIGTGSHVERRRWIFWRGEKKPLRW
ncbi:MAG: WD40 repeat domain-containing protein [Planctomycetota bacterium]